MRIGEQIRQAREAAGLTQGELAEKAKVHRTYVSQLERDLKSPTLDVFERLCASLNILPSKLMARIERR